MDLLLELNEHGEGAELVLAGGDLVLGRPVRGAALGALFCDARRPRDDDEPYRGLGELARGYWAAAPAESFGSLLWTCDPMKVTTEAIARIEDHARAALQWMVASGLVAQLEVRAYRAARDRIALDVELVRPTPIKWQRWWDEEDAGDVEAELGRTRLRMLTR